MIALPKRPTRFITIIGIADGADVTVFTAYGGPAAEREPNDPTIAENPDAVAAARAFWSDHALASRDPSARVRRRRLR